MIDIFSYMKNYMEERFGGQNILGIFPRNGNPSKFIL